MINLTIAVPTFNRAPRLIKCLDKLFILITKTSYKSNIAVFVSNNGSDDNTAYVLKTFKKKFSLHNIDFKYENLKKNYGLDFNIFNCYRNCKNGYLWIISDDDNLKKNSINLIYEDIDKYEPSVIYYNFEQSPYLGDKRYIRYSRFYENINSETLRVIYKLLRYPKITSFVFYKKNNLLYNRLRKLFPNLLLANYTYIHCAIALQTFLSYKKLLTSKSFIAFPDIDHLDHVDFPPYVGGELNSICYEILKHNKYLKFLDIFTFKITDPLLTSMNTIATFYKGKISLTPELKQNLVNTIFNEIKQKEIFNLLFNIKFLTLCIKIFLFIITDNISFIMFRKKLSKLKKRSDSYQE